MNCDTAEEFIKKCKLRDKADILDMLNLYFRYNWVINDAKVHPDSSTGAQDTSIVIERRRGLEWVVSAVDDWYDIEMRA